MFRSVIQVAIRAIFNCDVLRWICYIFGYKHYGGSLNWSLNGVVMTGKYLCQRDWPGSILFSNPTERNWVLAWYFPGILTSAVVGEYPVSWWFELALDWIYIKMYLSSYWAVNGLQASRETPQILCENVLKGNQKVNSLLEYWLYIFCVVAKTK